MIYYNQYLQDGSREGGRGVEKKVITLMEVWFLNNKFLKKLINIQVDFEFQGKVGTYFNLLRHWYFPVGTKVNFFTLLKAARFFGLIFTEKYKQVSPNPL